MGGVRILLVAKYVFWFVTLKEGRSIRVIVRLGER